VGPLVSWAATFSSVWEEEFVEGIMAQLREIALKKSQYDGKLGYKEVVAVAEQAEYLFLYGDAQSFSIGSYPRFILCDVTVMCGEREASTMKLMMQSNGDFAKWAESGQGVGLVSMEGKASLIRQEEGVFSGWNHAS
jgi:hypothetical protein